MSTRTPGLPTGPRLQQWYERLTLFRVMRTILIIAIVLIVTGGLLVRLIEPKVFSDVGLSFWWAVETVTTVGYGDIVPESTGGRLVGAALMLAGVALIPLVTSVAVSILTLKRSQIQHDEQAARLDRIEERLERLQG